MSPSNPLGYYPTAERFNKTREPPPPQREYIMANTTAGQSIILGAASLAAATGFLNPVPGADVAFLSGIWASMLGAFTRVLGEHFGLL
jgi:hypothetical protein